ncbi:MAG: ribonuclease Z [archaeon]|nr:ribonuclease Z [archaeon]
MLDVLFVGTGASVPSKTRAPPCIAIRQSNHITMFDCGEGSQRQMLGSQFSIMKIENIFITHLHGDHILGVPGLIQTMNLLGRVNPISIYGPIGTKASMAHLLDACNEELGFKINVIETKPGNKLDIDYALISTVKTEHSVPSMGYVYREPDARGLFNVKTALNLGLKPGPDFAKIEIGKTVNGVHPSQIIGPSRKGCSIMYTGDTKMCSSILEAAKGIDMLIHEATYIDKDANLAEKNLHSTAKNAAEVAKSCGARMLALVHISNRYKTNEKSLFEAKVSFNNTIAPSDLDMVSISRNSFRIDAAHNTTEEFYSDNFV